MSPLHSAHAVRRGAFCLAVLSVASAGQGATYTDDFSGGIDAARWNTSMTTANLYSIDATQSDIRFAKNAALASPGGFQNVALGFKLASIGGPVTGDFSARVLFRDARITGPVFSQVQFETFYADGTGILNVFDNYGSPTIGINVHVWDGSNILGAKALPADTTTGVLRIDRVGSAVTAYFNDTAVFTMNKTSALTGLRMTLGNNHNNANIGVTFDDFAVTVVPEPSALAVAGVGLLALRRRRG